MIFIYSFCNIGKLISYCGIFFVRELCCRFLLGDILEFVLVLMVIRWLRMLEIRIRVFNCVIIMWNIKFMIESFGKINIIW